MSYSAKAKDIYTKLFSGQLLDAFDQYYHNDVVMIEATGDKRIGKATNREYEVQFLESVKEWHGGGVVGITSDEEAGITMVESWIEVTFQNSFRTKMEQVARQKWQGEQIIEERFYYNAPS